jgi:hypothetical protein
MKTEAKNLGRERGYGDFSCQLVCSSPEEKDVDTMFAILKKIATLGDWDKLLKVKAMIDSI